MFPFFASVDACCPISIVAVFVFVVLAVLYQASQGRLPITFAGMAYANLADFVERFGQAVGLQGRAVRTWSSASSALFEGNAHGRSVSLWIEDRGKAGHAVHIQAVTSPGVRVPIVRLERRGFLEWLLGTRSFGGGTFVVAAGSPGAVLAIEAAEVELASAFTRFGVEQLALSSSVALLRANGASLRTPRDHADAIAALARILDVLESGEVAMPRVKVRPRAERLLRLRATSHVRCGFCHEELDVAALPVVACERCGTVLHEECWREHGHCPVLGCPEKRSRVA